MLNDNSRVACDSWARLLLSARGRRSQMFRWKWKRKVIIFSYGHFYLVWLMIRLPSFATILHKNLVAIFSHIPVNRNEWDANDKKWKARHTISLEGHWTAQNITDYRLQWIQVIPLLLFTIGWMIFFSVRDPLLFLLRAGSTWQNRK